MADILRLAEKWVWGGERLADASTFPQANSPFDKAQSKSRLPMVAHDITLWLWMGYVNQ